MLPALCFFESHLIRPHERSLHGEGIDNAELLPDDHPPAPFLALPHLLE